MPPKRRPNPRDGDLRLRLRGHGIDAVITDSTRKFFERKLKELEGTRCLRGFGVDSSPRHAVSSTETPHYDVKTDLFTPTLPGHIGTGDFSTQHPPSPILLTAELERSFVAQLERRSCADSMTIPDRLQGLKSRLWPHQISALKWMAWREEQNPPGGILADDMGLGKTVTAIALLLHQKHNGKGCGPTLVVVPASIIHQWENEVAKHCELHEIRVVVYHGPRRKQSTPTENELVLTTYGILRTRDSFLQRVDWARVILDEAHTIRNPKTATSGSVFELKARYRWALTGTPIQNYESDLVSLLIYLMHLPDISNSFMKECCESHAFLKTFAKLVVLRRTKSDPQIELMLTKRHWIEHDLKLSNTEKAIYNSVMQGVCQPSKRAWFTTHFVKLLRLRQCCTHPNLLKEVIEYDELHEDVDRSLEDRMQDLTIESETQCKAVSRNASHISAFEKEYESSKIKVLMAELRRLRNGGESSQPTKSIVVSQWTKLLDILQYHLTKERHSFCRLDGKTPVNDRMRIVKNFNSNSVGPSVMLLSLRAGGVGLNLIGANQLFLLDLSWNPAVEQQACDRIHRLGQTKDVFIHSFLCSGTIEEQIKELQKQKLDMAKDILNENVINNKLTEADIKFLFEPMDIS